ncbi:hypothetical protein EWH23_03045 [Meiothermus sp. PNK-Is4]|uniref:Uncharacterized protein n=1 Tax=Allomeiothermus silvanus (strain ATCC 700542 / DSM 9946 / NBRC 106475 / NCIMB 13440 / VI-R2) TaxID=526227 RepID=D7BA07_ALLS1|nr:MULTISPECIES: hypothetical protein [Thermaceae]ADH62441.1 hypothetical protein Mesil_0508 [Allomeiothermus silvanus DSM 9946]RYM39482.1 hypothetical protein EWH23_03045 [Meiothermus sp. PNK-Is4]
MELNASDLIEGKRLLGRWFTHRGRECVVRAVGEVWEMPGSAGREVGTWQLEVDGKALERVYGSLEAATWRLVERV